jgi:S1-C subfamily serine protease
MSASVLAALSHQLSTLVKDTANAVVAVHTGARHDTSGFVWRPGLVVTAEEALPVDEDIAVTGPDGQRHPAVLAGRDPSTDVALLRVTGIEHAAGPAGALAAGGLAVAVGRSGSLPICAMGLTAMAGPAWQSRRGGTIDADLRFDLRLPRAAEGGLLVNASGEPVAMAVFGPRRRVLGIPLGTIGRSAERILEKGSVGRGYLGLGLQPVPVAGSGQRGLMVLTVDPQGPGAAAGVLQGDVITGVDGAPLHGMRDIFRVLGPDHVGRKITVAVQRSGEERTFTVTVGERPRG